MSEMIYDHVFALATRQKNRASSTVWRRADADDNPNEDVDDGGLKDVSEDMANQDETDAEA